MKTNHYHGGVSNHFGEDMYLLTDIFDQLCQNRHIIVRIKSYVCKLYTNYRCCRSIVWSVTAVGNTPDSLSFFNDSRPSRYSFNLLCSLRRGIILSSCEQTSTLYVHFNKRIQNFIVACCFIVPYRIKVETEASSELFSVGHGQLTVSKRFIHMEKSTLWKNLVLAIIIITFFLISIVCLWLWNIWTKYILYLVIIFTIQGTTRSYVKVRMQITGVFNGNIISMSYGNYKFQRREMISDSKH